jgi:hypothetical protein
MVGGKLVKSYGEKVEALKSHGTTYRIASNGGGFIGNDSLAEETCQQLASAS